MRYFMFCKIQGALEFYFWYCVNVLGHTITRNRGCFKFKPEVLCLSAILWFPSLCPFGIASKCYRSMSILRGLRKSVPGLVYSYPAVSGRGSVETMGMVVANSEAKILLISAVCDLQLTRYQKLSWITDNVLWFYRWDGYQSRLSDSREFSWVYDWYQHNRYKKSQQPSPTRRSESAPAFSRQRKLAE